LTIELYERLLIAQKSRCLPSVTAFQRIDGPGSSLDLREFQQALWRLPSIPDELNADLTAKWSNELPRTIAITIDTGTKVTALPFKPGRIAVKSIDYGYEYKGTLSEVIPKKKYWLLKILELFNLSGVEFVTENLHSDTKSSGLGGSATVGTAVCILANELAGKPFNEIQIISMASRIEQDLGVSIVGTQEQSNVVFGGVKDYIWFPWGFPNKAGTGYGESIRTELITPKDYQKLESRMVIFHTGKTRKSANVNSIWRKALRTKQGFEFHKSKLNIAYNFREALRLQDWQLMVKTIRQYKDVRISLCHDYLNGAEEILKASETENGTAFPLGAGGGGAVLVVNADPNKLEVTKQKLKTKYTEIPFKIKSKGHEIANLL
jgi:D-glycero-alpha-D-manno-heptose-7-phosphate kinase